MTTLMVGISHKTSSISIREKFFLRSTERELLLSEFKNDPAVVDAVILSTCNRTEIYANILGDNADGLLSHLFKVKNIPFETDLKKCFYFYMGEEAIAQLFRVACGLDSLILGEKQILGQVKKSFELSQKMSMMNKEFNILANLVTRAGKKAQHETQISCGGSSVSWAAVSMAQKMLGTLRRKNVLIIGAGKMSHLTASQLANNDVGRIYVMNRTFENAKSLAAQINATAVSFWDIKEVFREIDVGICSVGAPHYVVERELIHNAMATRPDRPLILIDISTPRNINPEVASVENVKLVSIDELDQVVESTLNKRLLAVPTVEEIITNKIGEYFRKIEKVKQYEASLTLKAT